MVQGARDLVMSGRARDARAVRESGNSKTEEEVGPWGAVLDLI